MEEAERLDKEFSAQGLSRSFYNSSRIKLKDKYGRVIKARHGMLKHYPIATLMKIAEELSDSPLVKELTVKMECESLIAEAIRKSHALC